MTQGGLARSYGLLKDEDEGDEEDDEEMFFCQSDPLPASSVGLLRNSVVSTR